MSAMVPERARADRRVARPPTGDQQHGRGADGGIGPRATDDEAAARGALEPPVRERRLQPGRRRVTTAPKSMSTLGFGTIDMKLQTLCGAGYALDVTARSISPAMNAQPASVG